MVEERLGTGISGLDEMLGGGMPKGHTVVVIGAFGTGKTTFSLQFVHEGLKQGESALFISLEEDEDSMVKNAMSYGLDLKPYISQNKLRLIKLEPSDAKATVNKIKTDLPEFIRSFGATRIALDSVSLFNMMFDDMPEKRKQLFNLYKLLKDTGATTLLTAEADLGNLRASKDGLAEYVSDGVILLRYLEKDEIGEVQLSVQIVKMRRVKHSRRIKPYAITDNGIIVQTEAEVF